LSISKLPSVSSKNTNLFSAASQLKLKYPWITLKNSKPSFGSSTLLSNTNSMYKLISTSVSKFWHSSSKKYSVSILDNWTNRKSESTSPRMITSRNCLRLRLKRTLPSGNKSTRKSMVPSRRETLQPHQTTTIWSPTCPSWLD
jgi:hypothetical protein